VSLRPIAKGEEVFTNYNYPSVILGSKRGLNWFSDLAEATAAKTEL
jgi:hypothetical protein